MNDLRHDPNVAFVTISDSHGVMQEIDVRAAQTLDVADLRTVPMPDLRQPAVHRFDTRTVDERVTAELVRLVDCLQLLYLRMDEVERQLPALEYLAQHVERLERTARPVADLGYTEQVDYWNSVAHLAAQRLGELSAAGVAA